MTKDLKIPPLDKLENGEAAVNTREHLETHAQYDDGQVFSFDVQIGYEQNIQKHDQ